MDNSTQIQDRKKKSLLPSRQQQLAMAPAPAVYQPTAAQMQIYNTMRANNAGGPTVGNPQAPSGVMAVPAGPVQLPAANPAPLRVSQAIVQPAVGGFMSNIGQAQQPAVTPAATPNLMGQPTMSQQQWNDSLGRLQNLGDMGQKFMDEYDKAGDRFPMPEEYKQSPFEQQMSQALEKRIMDLTSDRKTPLDRFNRGYDLGQRLAADIIVPAFGTFTKSGGRAIGAMQASQAMKQSSEQSDNLRAQTQQLHNQLIANLASLYENMNPDSAKNLANLTALKYQRAQDLTKAKLEAGRNALQAASDQIKGYQGLHGTQIKDQTRQDKNILGSIAAGNKTNLTNATVNNINSQIDYRKGRLNQGDQRIGLDKQKQGTYAKSVNNTNNNATLNRQLDAQKAFRSAMDAFTTKLSVTGANGLLKYPTAASLYNNNSAEIENLQHLADTAGVKTSVKDMISSAFTQREAKLQQSSPSGTNLNVGGLLNQLMGKPSPDEDRSVLPTRPTPSISTPGANDFRPSQQASSAASNKKYDYLVHEFATDFEKRNGRRPTQDEMRQALKGYANANGQ